jgi:hypothetical protein
MTAFYDHFGVKFLYPENWVVSQEESAQWPREVSLQCPGGGFWSLHVYSTPDDPRELVAEVVRTMGQEYDNLESRPASEDLAGIKAVGCDMDFYCLDLVVTAQVRSFQLGDRTFLVLCQAESREFDELERVFQAITLSLIAQTGNRREF